jgi:hypothetical protein
MARMERLLLLVWVVGGGGGGARLDLVDKVEGMRMNE